MPPLKTKGSQPASASTPSTVSQPVPPRTPAVTSPTEPPATHEATPAKEAPSSETKPRQSTDVSTPAPAPVPAPPPSPSLPLPQTSQQPPVTPAAPDKQTAAKPPKPSVSFTGRSISAILDGGNIPDPYVNTAEDTAVKETVEIDAHTVERLEKGCALFAKNLIATRPRIGVVFENVEIDDNRIRMKAPNESLREEILRNQAELKKRLLDLCGLDIPLEFHITVEIDQKGIKPVKAEDKLTHLTKKNPLLTELRKKLDLDIE